MKRLASQFSERNELVGMHSVAYGNLVRVYSGIMVSWLNCLKLRLFAIHSPYHPVYCVRTGLSSWYTVTGPLWQPLVSYASQISVDSCPQSPVRLWPGTTHRHHGTIVIRPSPYPQSTVASCRGSPQWLVRGGVGTDVHHLQRKSTLVKACKLTSLFE